jgi:tripartite-type tricarboxylate transporter receptor subunit TctC
LRVFKKVTETKIFKNYAQKSGAVINFTNAAETVAFLEGREKVWRPMLKKFGLIKKKKKK